MKRPVITKQPQLEDHQGQTHYVVEAEGSKVDFKWMKDGTVLPKTLYNGEQMLIFLKVQTVQ